MLSTFSQNTKIKFLMDKVLKMDDFTYFYQERLQVLW